MGDNLNEFRFDNNKVSCPQFYCILTDTAYVVIVTSHPEISTHRSICDNSTPKTITLSKTLLESKTLDSLKQKCQDSF